MLRSIQPAAGTAQAFAQAAVTSPQVDRATRIRNMPLSDKETLPSNLRLTLSTSRDKAISFLKQDQFTH
jgi:hypothetical protein